ncbi:MAG: polyphosphate kinase 1 [Gammaproteobacteria bacterium]
MASVIEEVIPAEPAAEPAEIDLKAPELYLNRELTWLAFNWRVLHEAEDPRTPLLERVKFLSIVNSNLDEFFMKRIGGLKQQIAANVNKPTPDGRTAREQIELCREDAHRFYARCQAVLGNLLAELEEENIRLVDYSELNATNRADLREHFINNIFPVLTPLAMDPGHPFPFISNLALNLLVTLRYPGEGNELSHMARIKVPVSKDVAPRFLRVGEDNTFVALESVILHNLDLLFPGMEIESCEAFRVTRNADVEMDEDEAEDLLEMIQTELRERHMAAIVRLEVVGNMDETHAGMLAAELNLEEGDVFRVHGMLAMRDLMEIAGLRIPSLKDPSHRPIDHPRLGNDSRNIFYIIRNGGPMLLQHPYESFTTSVERFLRSAANDSKVLGIKMTLYRTSAEGRIIEYLIKAARNGKQVAVLVELKARFDEAANIRWARRLEEHGIHVTYGVVGLKTHSKIIMVIRKDFNGLQRYVHIGTGNYHSGTARLYSDLGMFSNDPDIGQDLTELFNYLTGYSPPPSYRKILAAPYTLKRALIEKIEREIAHKQAGREARIQLKTNALEDAEVTEALYKATRAGVQLDLIIRDTCRFRPNLPGISESARVISIVGRFLEHTRIFYFLNGGQEEYYIGSADIMKRNLDSRVEVVAPVEDPVLQQDLRMMLDAQLADQRSAWDMKSDGSYEQRQPSEGMSAKSSQEMLIEAADKRRRAVTKHKQEKVRTRLAAYFRRRLEKEEGAAGASE